MRKGTMQIEAISSRLVRNEEGIYVASNAEAVSYPAEGHAQCFQVEDHSFWFRHRNACIAAMVERQPFAGTLLDIGGGNGYVSQMLASRGHEVVLIEPGEAGARNARLQRGLANVVCSTIEDAQFAPHSFGAIGMFDVIEHIERDRDFITGIASLLKTDGRLYLTVPCHRWLWSQADVEAGHFRRHTLSSLRTLLLGVFEIDYLSYFFEPLIAPQFLLRTLPYRLGLGRNKLLSSESEHGSRQGTMVRMLDRLLAREVDKVAKGEALSFGASCLVAARCP
jgi:SAM-dependent methyltransferase